MLWMNVIVFSIIVKNLELQLAISKQQGDDCITEISMRFGFEMQKRKSINSFRITMKVILASELAVLNRNVINHFYREGL